MREPNGDYREQPLCGPLARSVNALWQACATQPRLILPDGSTDLIVNGVTGELFVVGAMTSAFVAPAQPGALFGVRLQPWAAFSWLGVAASELVDDKVPLREVAPALAAALAGASSAKTLLEKLACSERARVVDGRVLAAFRALASGAHVAGAARAVGLTERQLGRLFKQHVGIGPKLLARVLRLRRALTQPADSLAAAAANNDYFDQAHLCREARALVGMSAARARAELRYTRSDLSKRP